MHHGTSSPGDDRTPCEYHLHLIKLPSRLRENRTPSMHAGYHQDILAIIHVCGKSQHAHNVRSLT